MIMVMMMMLSELELIGLNKITDKEDPRSPQKDISHRKDVHREISDMREKGLRIKEIPDGLQKDIYRRKDAHRKIKDIRSKRDGDNNLISKMIYKGSNSEKRLRIKENPEGLQKDISHRKDAHGDDSDNMIYRGYIQAAKFPEGIHYLP
ncbi:hypothetical protein CEXT_107811 [Caerostris extrusa]|uniref:Uncharacterized protein n=1 Tax=Caerostris extrusa TaxID=172846 RepID=A0AAV4RCK6_CAEEX|nr:hypothetical protein CEXT_107811 [Caerostris extrusa]